MVKWTAFLVIALLIVACAAAVAEEGKTPVALSYQIYYPSNSTTRDVFGNGWSGFGLDVLRPQECKKWDFLISFHGMTSGDDASIYALNAGVIRGLGSDEKIKPFVILQAGPFYGDVDVPGVVHESNWGINANATAGVVFNERFQISARYDVYSEVGGFNFNGLTLSAGIKLFDL